MKKPSVTELCDILNKPQLLKWANKIGLEGKSISLYQNNKLENGKKKHKEIEEMLMHGISINDKIKEQQILNLFENCEIISIEESFENDKYKGRVDIRFKKNGITYIGDFKSTFKRPYIEHFIQLICYKMHFKDDKICIINLDNFQLYDLTTTNENLYIELINNLINIYKLKQIL